MLAHPNAFVTFPNFQNIYRKHDTAPHSRISFSLSCLRLPYRLLPFYIREREKYDNCWRFSHSQTTLLHWERWADVDIRIYRANVPCVCRVDIVGTVVSYRWIRERFGIVVYCFLWNDTMVLLHLSDWNRLSEIIVENDRKIGIAERMPRMAIHTRGAAPADGWYRAISNFEWMCHIDRDGRMGLYLLCRLLKL